MEIAVDPATHRRAGLVPAAAATAGDGAVHPGSPGVLGHSFTEAFVRLARAAPAEHPSKAAAGPAHVPPAPQAGAIVPDAAVSFRAAPLTEEVPQGPAGAAGATGHEGTGPPPMPAPAIPRPEVTPEPTVAAPQAASPPAERGMVQVVAPPPTTPDVPRGPVAKMAAQPSSEAEDAPGPEDGAVAAAAPPAMAGAVAPVAPPVELPQRAASGPELPGNRAAGLPAPPAEGRPVEAAAPPPASGDGRGTTADIARAPISPTMSPMASMLSAALSSSRPERAEAELPRLSVGGGPGLPAAGAALSSGSLPGVAGPVTDTSAVIRQLAHAADGGRTGVVEIALSPPELGRVRMQLAPTEAGLVVTIVAERGETADLLRRHGDDLLRDLRSAGHASVTLDVSTSGAGPDGRSAGTAARSWPEAAIASADPVPGPDAALGVVALARRPGLDLRL